MDKKGVFVEKRNYPVLFFMIILLILIGLGIWKSIELIIGVIK